MNNRNQFGFLGALLTGALLSSVALTGAIADEHVYTANDPVWKEECGSCHIAYPPRLLPASSWRELMSGLNRHFGTDASVDPQTAKHVAAFLERNAGRDHVLRGSPTLRITETRWFVHEHNEVPDRVWRNPKVKSAANCTACHVRGDKGNFDEHGIRIPR